MTLHNSTRNRNLIDLNAAISIIHGNFAPYLLHFHAEQHRGKGPQCGSKVLYNCYGGKDMLKGLIMDQAKWVTDSFFAFSAYNVNFSNPHTV